ncbi:patatin-like phospholipase family protein [Orenia marismortui]|uniref:NTE family protein n=1 Tax=Orenia marismortui TaxID=46469 RepID=A0A4R8GXV8_9FIRM|nr:patatin-like phospholipase family protein [Orenia marismortui]TDX51160.1 NTE family protein [Orenia marismortui]
MSKKFRIYLTVLLLVSLNSTYVLANINADSNLTRVVKDEEIYLVEDYQRFKSSSRPKVAVALTGGGAKAFFNIGVIKALEEEDIPIDLIVGTSMGSIIGTMYGSGISIEQIEEIVTEAPFTNLLEMNFIDNDSFFETAKVNKFLENIAPYKRLEKFPIPTALLTLEVDSGHKYIITTDRISKVVQASYAIPHFFPLYQMEDKYFADPGILENSPAKAAKALGADFVIATTYTADKSHDSYETPNKIINRYVDIVSEKNNKRILNNYSDIIVEADISGYSFFDFSSAGELIEIGYQSTKDQISKLKVALKSKRIPLRKRVARKKLALDQEFNDIKYDRILVSSIIFNPVLHYGQDYSFFKQDLLRSYLNIPQYGFEFEKDKVDFKFLATNNVTNDLEAELRWKKLTQNTDLIAKTRIESNETDDGEIGIRYYEDNYFWSAGVGSINNNSYVFADAKYELGFNRLDLEGEIDLFFDEAAKVPKILISKKTVSKLSDSWLLKPKVVFNNSELIESPLIYRGSTPDDFSRFQFSLDYAYTHQFVKSIKLTKIIDIKDIGAYLFTDYLNDKESSLAYGVGFNGDFYLLGLKPFRLDCYLSYDQNNEESIIRANLNYNF